MTDVALSPQALPAATLVGAIAAVMAEVHTVAKLGVNDFHGYRYARIGDILQEITPLLGKHGLVIFQSETGRAMFDDENVIAVEYSFTVAHVSGETWPHPLRQTGVSFCRATNGRWDDKSLNKCHTAARKYFLLALFQIPTGDEDDADQGENERPARQINSRPLTVVPAPKHRLKPGGNAARAIDRRYEATIRTERALQRSGPSKPFRASDAGKEFARPRYDERNPPPHEGIPSFLDRRTTDAAKALNRRLHPIDDEVPF